MRRKIFLLPVILLALGFQNAQALNYTEEWKKVEQFEDAGRSQDALNAVKIILEKAKAGQNDPQTIKAQLYKYKYMMRLEEDSEWKIVNEIKLNITQAQGAERAILHSILAQLYNQYYLSNSWKFSKRTKTTEKQSEDFRTWDLQTLFEEIRAEYLASLRDKTILQQVLLENFSDILSEEKKSKKFRPTLYDLLAHRAIDFFSADAADLTQPANAFSIDEKAYFATAADFIKLDIQTEDTLSNSRTALKIFQDLLQFRMAQNNPDALADADLKRIKYVQTHYSDKDSADIYFLEAMQRMAREYAGCAMGASINYELANYIYSKASEKNTSFKYTVKVALDICNQTISKYPDSDGSRNCEALKSIIFGKELSVTTEANLIPGEPSKALLQFRNVNKVYLKWVKVDYKDKDKLFNLKDKETDVDLVNRLNGIKPVKSWAQALPGTADYLSHSAEIKIEPAQKGFYILMASTNPAFTIANGAEAVTVSTIFVTSLSYTLRENNDDLFEIYVLDRNSGNPLKGASVHLYHMDYDYTDRKYKQVDYGTVITDLNGYASKKIAGKKYDNYDYSSFYYQFDVRYKDDFLPSRQNFYAYSYPKTEPADQYHLHIFTDRAIYRPGQTIYYKGILIKSKGEDNSIVTNQKVEMNFQDANYKTIRTETLTTNDFGSFSGTFIAPSTGLLGEMRLNSIYGSEGIRVEEYKRPKFEVVFDTIKKAYNLNDTITSSGKAVSYSGANLGQAEVKYKVVRRANFPIWFWWSWRKPWFPPTPEKIIEVGNTKTDEEGNFKIDFTAIPDLSVSKEFKPYFDYEIIADVTDINGETQSNTTVVRVGYLSIEAEVNVEDKLDNSKENKITVSTRNLNGTPEPTDVTLKIYDLVEPVYPKKKRLWSEPDTFSMSKTEHDKYFPYEIYDNEDQAENWQKGKLVNTYQFNTGKQTEIKLPEGGLPSGAYLIEFSCKDKNGTALDFKKTFSTYNSSDNTLNPKEFAWMNVPETTVRPGDSVVYQLGSSMPDAYFVVEVMHRDSLVEKRNIFINNSIQTFTIAVKENYLGGMEIRFTCVYKNRYFTDYKFVDVPLPDKNLTVEWESFRDKLLPGQKETWKLKIKGPQKEKVAAEMVASLYDASLDAFVPHSFNFYLNSGYYAGFLKAFTGEDDFAAVYGDLHTSKNWNPYKPVYAQGYDDLNLFDLSIGYSYRYKYMDFVTKSESIQMAGEMSQKKEAAATAPPMPKNTAGQADVANKADEKPADKPKPPVVPRTNLNETAFFFPQLQTDDSGNVILDFTMPEALTKWNFLGFAHTTDLQYSYFKKSVQTQKDLMVVPNPPRFLREGDKLEFTAKISNLSSKDLEGKADLVLYDAATMKEITPKIMEAVHGNFNTIGERDFSAGKGKNTVVSWTLQIPSGTEAIYYKVTARAGDHSDGEAAVLPVLPNKMLVTETMPLWITGKTTKNYTFNKLLSNKSTTLKNYSLSLEMTSNPAWYAVQALPYILEYPYECSEQLFSRYYANSLASHIANSNPRLKQVFDQWKNSNALVSNLEKNQELKNILLEETPWVRDAENETEQKKRIALLFDLNKMADEKNNALNKLIQLQTPNGGFSWFPGMPDNEYITQYIVAGFGHLNKLQVENTGSDEILSEMLNKAVLYLDERMRENYDNIRKYDKDFEKNNHLSYDMIYYLYARSFFPALEMDKKNKEANAYFLSQTKKYWLQQGMYAQGLIALVANRNNDKATANKLIESMRQNAIHSEELGMYWKSVENPGWYWYEAPVEIQSLLIEAFTEVAADEKSVDEMKVWLLKQKQTTSWKTTKATAEACYALLLGGSDWVSSASLVEVKMDKQTIDPKADNVSVEPGTGYYKIKWSGSEIKPGMANIQLKKNEKGPAWGAVYWQYFEELDKISGAATNLQLTKKYFKKVSTANGDELQEITEKSPVKVGDLITVRIELRTDRNLEYVHLKDMRAAGMEPTNVLSQYKYQDNLGYYESTRDVATHIFMDWMPKGIYVFEYNLRASLAGEFSSGIAQVECMYAPEFKSHSNGQKQVIAKC